MIKTHCDVCDVVVGGYKTWVQFTKDIVVHLNFSTNLDLCKGCYILVLQQNLTELTAPEPDDDIPF